MAKKKIKKSEKYIREVVRESNKHYLRIEIRAYEQTFRKTIAVSDFDTPKQAMEFAKQLRDETLQKMRAGYTVSGFKTVRELYDRTFVLLPVRLKTKQKHDYFFKYGIEKWADVEIDKITSGDVQESLNDYALTHTRRQVNGLLAVWRRIFKACAMDNINVIDRTVAVIVPAGIQGKKRKKEISADELEIFCDALLAYNAASKIGSYYCTAVYYAIQIMKYCGLRPAEAFALLKSDINLAAGYISIDKAARSTYISILEISDTKTEKSVRRVPIPADLRPILEECLAWSMHDIMLADYFGNLLSIDDVDTLIRNIRTKKCPDIDFTLYMLRHQFSTDLHNAGVTPNVIRDLMGHESATQSLDYAVSNEADRLEAINSRRFS